MVALMAIWGAQPRLLPPLPQESSDDDEDQDEGNDKPRCGGHCLSCSKATRRCSSNVCLACMYACLTAALATAGRPLCCAPFPATGRRA